jgi:hypothetical protein
MKPSLKTVFTSAALAGMAAAFINSILFVLFNTMGIIPDNVFVQENQPLTVVPVIISSIVPSLLAGVVFYLLCRYSNKGYRIFSTIAIILLILSFANPFIAIKSIPLGMGLALNAMHIVVVTALLYSFKRIKASEHKITLS